MIGFLEHTGYVSSWKITDGYSYDNCYYTLQEDNEIIDVMQLYKELNGDKSINALRCNACFIESPDRDIGILYLVRSAGGFEYISKFINPLPAMTPISDTGFIFDAFQVIAPSGTKVKFIVNYM